MIVLNAFECFQMLLNANFHLFQCLSMPILTFYNPFEYFKHGDKDYRKKNTLNKNLRSKTLIFLKYLNSYLFCASK